MRKLTGLDVLRGIATLLIVIHHTSTDVLPGIPAADGFFGWGLWRIRNIGWTGIDFFFVLSGFFMGHTILTELQDRGTIRLTRFWKRRFTRIIPSYYVLLLVLGITGASGYLNTESLQGGATDLLVHLFFLNNYIDPLPNGPTWFLAATVQFYLAIPILFFLLYRCSGSRLLHHFLKIALGLASLTIGLRVGTVLLGTHTDNDFMLTHYRLDAILVGMAAFYLLQQNHPVVLWMRRHSIRCTLIALLVIAPAMFLSRSNSFMFTAGFVMLECGYAALILLIADGAIKPDRNWTGWLRAIAVWSYNIYLWHYFLPVLLGRPFECLQEGIHRIIPSANVEVAAQIVAFTALSIAAGYIATLAVEKPMSRLLGGERTEDRGQPADPKTAGKI